MKLREYLGDSCCALAPRSAQTIAQQRERESGADFIAKLGIVEEERDESAYWMEMIAALKLLKKGRLTDLLSEANELLANAVASIKTARRSRRA
jgi:four helix bundle protein